MIDNIPLDVWTKYGPLTNRTGQSTKMMIRNYVISRLINKEPLKVLDYGCGPAGTIGFSDMNNILIIDGLDHDKSNARAKYHGTEEIAGMYDIIIFSHVIEHMTPADAEEALRWMRAHGKTLLMCTPNSLNPSFDFTKDLTHVRPYSTPHTLALLESMGFTVKKVYYANRGGKADLLFRLLPCLWREGHFNALYYEWMVVAE